MAKYDKVPRKKKKALKKSAGLQGQKTTKKQVVSLANKEEQKKKRDAATTRRYNANKAYLESLNIPTSIISKSTSIKETKKRAEKYIAERSKNERQYKQANLVARKINRLLDAGFTQEEAEKTVGGFWHPASDKKIEEIIYQKQYPINEDIALKGSKYLYVGICEVKDGFNIPNTKMLTIDQLKDNITEVLEAAKRNPDGSASFASAFQYKMGSKSNMEHRANVFYKRGYDMNPEHLKLTPERYQKITVSNTWTAHDFYSMFYTCITQMKNADVLDFNDYLKDYCVANGFPFMDDFPYLDMK